MRLLINPKRRLFQWGPIAFRLFYGAIFCEVLWLGTKKVYHWAWPPCLGLYDHGRTAFVLDDAELRAVGKKYFRTYFLNRSNYRRQWRMWEEWMARYDRVAAQLHALNFRLLTDAELVRCIEEMYVFNREFWMIVHVPEIANWGGESMLLARLQAIDRTHAHDHLEILAAPVKYSFFQEEELALLRIITPPDSSYLKRREVFAEHARQWNWILNSYGGNRVLDARFFEKKRRALLREESAASHIRAIVAARQRNIRRKRVLAARLKLSKRDMLMAEQLSQSIWWQDQRKGYIWQLNSHWDRMLQEVARRHDWTFHELLWCWPHELIRIARGERVDRRTILSRSKDYVNELTEHGMRHYYGVAARRYRAAYLSAKSAQGEGTLHGLAVSKGNGKPIVGRAVIIQDPFADGHRMRKGDILVAAMTSPEFIVVMKKASAIVTDHGGMTSHAAIVSRELGIPCIVGTKHATSVLKTGDKVEVDATAGVVRILSK